ncbi:ankyrin repeat domain-containing protein 49-like [Brevipalpus obovatus]|uniref:ankyrin repeat domain-containing protein 49-like n=1 Tax=Brevipalpus obovatus TaxID=246614 RepID=UPI003D9F1661
MSEANETERLESTSSKGKSLEQSNADELIDGDKNENNKNGIATNGQSECKTQETEKTKLTKEEKMFKFCARGTPHHVRYMLKKDPSLISICDTDNYTPLHRACYHNNVEVVKFLIENGADTDARTVEGWTPLHCTARWEAMESAAVLLQSGANINVKSDGDVYPIHLAATTKNRKLLELFLYHPDVDVNVKNGAGDTPLDIAYRSSPYYRLFDQIKY